MQNRQIAIAASCRESEVGDGIILDAPDWGVEEIPEHPIELEYWKKLEIGNWNSGLGEVFNPFL